MADTKFPTAAARPGEAALASSAGLSRRAFLSLPLIGLAIPPRAVSAGPQRTTRGYEANLGILFDLLTLSMAGSVTTEIDQSAGRYHVTMDGTGPGVSGRSESSGIIRGGRYMPTETRSTHVFRGRENRLALTYDYDRGVVEYHSLSYTILLGRRRQVDDAVRIAPGQRVDDAISAELNFAANALEVGPDGSYHLTVVRRARAADEGPDDVAANGYRAELASLSFHPVRDAATGQIAAMIDLSGFSSWARASRPAHVGFGADRHLESIKSSLILGTTFTLTCTSRA